jgi:DNA-binding MarR family transcriptional regulator
MSALARFPDGLRMSEISALLKVSNGNVTGIVDRLVQDGMAVRVAVPGDKRAQIARLTRAGLVAFDGYARAHETWLDEMLGGLQGDDLAAMGRVLDRVKRHLEDKDAQ